MRLSLVVSFLFLVLGMEVFGKNSAISEKQAEQILNFIKSEVEWSQTYPYPMNVRLEEASLNVTFISDNNYSAFGTVVESDDSDETEGQVTCRIVFKETSRGERVDYLKSTCYCDSGIKCGEGNLFDE
jgi:hypothetical protein